LNKSLIANDLEARGVEPLFSKEFAPRSFGGTLIAKILKISGQEIDQALRNVTRQYLVGDLQKPQALQRCSMRHVPSSLIEIGITRYEDEGKLERYNRLIGTSKRSNFSK
jgi:hypothetical protein